jgi:hypothetical protein
LIFSVPFAVAASSSATLRFTIHQTLFTKPLRLPEIYPADNSNLYIKFPAKRLHNFYFCILTFNFLPRPPPACALGAPAKNQLKTKN